MISGSGHSTATESPVRPGGRGLKPAAPRASANAGPSAGSSGCVNPSASGRPKKPLSQYRSFTTW